MVVEVNVIANDEMENLIFLPGASGNTDFWRPVVEQLATAYNSTILAYPEFGAAQAHADVKNFDDLQRYILQCIATGSSIGECRNISAEKLQLLSVAQSDIAEVAISKSAARAVNFQEAMLQKNEGFDHSAQEPSRNLNHILSQELSRIMQNSPVINTLDTPMIASASKQKTIIAQSMGGIFAVQAALKFPKMIKALVLVATSGGIDLSAFNVLDWRQDYQLTYAVPHWFVTQHEVLDDELSKIDCPVLLIWGDQDLISPVSVGEYLVTKFRNASLHIVQGGEHDLANVHFDKVSTLIQTFLQGIK